jgi:hypothetical protein
VGPLLVWPAVVAPPGWEAADPPPEGLAGAEDLAGAELVFFD